MGDRMEKLESAMQALHVPPETAERVRKAIRDGLSPATIHEFRERGVPQEVVDRALGASEEYHRAMLATEPVESAQPALEPSAEETTGDEQAASEPVAPADGSPADEGPGLGFDNQIA